MHTTYEAPQTIGRMMFLSQSFLYSLTHEQRRACEFPMDDPSRLDWDFIPKSDRTGIPMFQLNFHQRTLIQTLLKAALSMRGYTQALEIMAMENILRELEVDRFGVSTGDFRSQDLYYVSFFGRPSFEDTWAWRFLGHHLSLSYTIVGQRWLSVTPCNMGAQPAEMGVLSPLRADEELGLRDPAWPRRSAAHAGDHPPRRPRRLHDEAGATRRARSSTPTTSTSGSAGIRSTTKTAKRSSSRRTGHAESPALRCPPTRLATSSTSSSRSSGGSPKR